MPNIASWNPPAELLQLGEPDRAYWSRRISPQFFWTTALLVTLAVAMEGLVLYVAMFTPWVPATQQYLIYLVSAACLAFAGGVVVNAILKSSKRPKFFYGFYPSGLVVLTNGGRWGFMPWRDIRAFDRKYGDPLLCLEDRTQIVVTHDFPDPDDFYTDLARYVEAKNRLVDEMPITASLVKYDKATKRQLVFGAALLGVTLAASFVYLDWIDLVVVADRMASPETWAKATQVEQLPRPWMTLPCPTALSTPGQITSRREGVTYVDSKIVLVPIGDRFLVANVRNNFNPGKMLRGEVSNWLEDDGPQGDQKKAALSAIAAEFPQHKDKILPLHLDATAPTEIYAQLTSLSLAIGLVIGIGLLGRGVWAARHSRPRLVLNDRGGIRGL